MNPAAPVTRYFIAVALVQSGGQTVAPADGVVGKAALVQAGRIIEVATVDDDGLPVSRYAVSARSPGRNCCHSVQMSRASAP